MSLSIILYQDNHQVCWAFAGLIYAVAKLPLFTAFKYYRVSALACTTTIQGTLLEARELGSYLSKEFMRRRSIPMQWYTSRHSGAMGVTRFAIVNGWSE